MWVKCYNNGPLINLALAWQVRINPEANAASLLPHPYALQADFPGGYIRTILNCEHADEAERALDRLHLLQAKGARELDALRDLLDAGPATDDGAAGACPVCQDDLLQVGEPRSGYKQCVNCGFRSDNEESLLGAAEAVVRAFYGPSRTFTSLDYISIISRLEQAVRAERREYETARALHIAKAAEETHP